MIERIGKVLYEFEEKHPILANILGISILYIVGLLITIIFIYKVL